MLEWVWQEHIWADKMVLVGKKQCIKLLEDINMGGLTPEYLQKLTQNQGPAQGFMASMQEKQSQKKLDAKGKQDLFRAMAAKYQLKEGVEPPKGFEGMEEIVGMFDTSKADKQDLLPTITFDPLKGKFFKTDKETGQQERI